MKKIDLLNRLKNIKIRADILDMESIREEIPKEIILSLIEYLNDKEIEYEIDTITF